MHLKTILSTGYRLTSSINEGTGAVDVCETASHGVMKTKKRLLFFPPSASRNYNNFSILRPNQGQEKKTPQPLTGGEYSEVVQVSP